MGVRLLGYLVATTALFVLSLLVALLSGVRIPDQAMAWLEYLPNWLQAIATIFGVVLAWKAYREWTGPEVARAKAQQAKELLVEVDELVERIKAARVPGSSFARPIKVGSLKRVVRAYRKERVEACHTETMRVARKLVTVLDEKAQEEIGKLVEIGKKIWMAFGYVETLYGDYEDEDHQLESTEEEKDVVEFLKVLGIRERGKREVDEIDKQIAESRELIRRVLRNQMEFKS